MRAGLALLFLVCAASACDIFVHVKSDTAKKFGAQVTDSAAKKSDRWSYTKKLEKNSFHQKGEECGVKDWEIATFDEAGKPAHSVKVNLDGIGRVTYIVGDDLVPKQKDRQGAICKGECAPL